MLEFSLFLSRYKLWLFERKVGAGFRELVGIAENVDSQSFFYFREVSRGDPLR